MTEVTNEPATNGGAIYDRLRQRFEDGLNTKWNEFVGQTVLIETDYTKEELVDGTTIEGGKFGKPRGAVERYLVLKVAKQNFDPDFSESQLSHRSRTSSVSSVHSEKESEYSSAVEETVIDRKPTQFYNDTVLLETFGNQSLGHKDQLGEPKDTSH